MAGVGNSSALRSQFPTITPRKSNRAAKSGAEMMDMVVDDIIRYESLAEMDEMMALDTLIHCDKVENTGSVVELVEVTPISIMKVSACDAQWLVETEGPNNKTKCQLLYFQTKRSLKE
jgi:hypothetical protein